MLKSSIKNPHRQRLDLQFQQKATAAKSLKSQYYADVAEKLGRIIRRDLVSTQKNRNERYTKSLELVKESMDYQRKPRLPPARFPLHNRSQFFQEKKVALEQFKYDLRRERESRATKKEQQKQELTTRIRWRKKQMKEISRIKTSFYNDNKFKEVELMKKFKNRTKEEHERRKKQLQLEQTFNMWERKLRPSTTNHNNR